MLQVFLCADLWKDAPTLKAAYHDSAGVTEAFIRNGLHNALRTLGMSQESPDVAKWPYHVVVNPDLQQVGPYVYISACVMHLLLSSIYANAHPLDVTRLQTLDLPYMHLLQKVGVCALFQGRPTQRLPAPHSQ